jgi:hypothetical protein
VLLITGSGLGLLVSQLNNYTLSPIEEERVSEAAGVNSAAGSFGLSFGLAMAGGIMLAFLAFEFTNLTEESNVIPPVQQQQIADTLEDGAEVMSNAQLEPMLADEPPDVQAEILRINTDGFHAFREAYAPGRPAAEVLASAEKLFVERGCGRLTMNMVLVGAEFAIARVETILGEFCVPSLEVAGPGGHWVEVSRALGTPNAEVQRMNEAYDEYFEAAQSALRPGATAHDAHRAVSKGFTDRGYHLGHVTGHSIGMTMIEFPKIGEGIETVLEENMVFSMHPHAISEDGQACLYMQDTWLVGPDGGEPLAPLPMRIFFGSERRDS